MAKTRALTLRKTIFCDEYIKDFNGTQAAIRAGYSAKTANEQAVRLLANVSIQSYISDLLKKRSERTEITQDRVLLEIARLAFNDPRKVFDKNNSLLPINQWPDEAAAAISSIKITESTDADGAVLVQTKEVKFWDKGRQLELAAKHLGMLTGEKDKDTDTPEPKQIVFNIKNARIESTAS